MDNRTNVKKYKRLAPFYDLMTENRFFLAPRQKAIETLRLQPGEKVLLVGVGTGQDLPLLPPDVFITGIDLSEDMLMRVQRKIPGRSITLEQMNAEQLSYADETFDAVILSLVLSVVGNPQKALAEAVRVVKNTGRIVIYDKFLDETRNPSICRKMLNRITVSFGTDINLRFSDILGSIPCSVVKDIPFARGMYRIILLCKD